MNTDKVEENVKGCGCLGLLILAAIVVIIALVGSCGTDDESTVSLPKSCDESPSCVVVIKSDELIGIDVDQELLDKQRETWKSLWAKPNIKSAEVTITAPVTDVGGNSSVSPILSVSCQRRRKINWDQVTPDGVKQLCNWQERVNFD